MDAFGSLRPGSAWYASGLRWLAGLLHASARWLDAPPPGPMPRHTSYEEVMADIRNRTSAFL